MQRINAIDPAVATGKAKDLLDAVKAKLGLVPNMMRTMAQSPAVLESYLNFSGALASGTLSAGLREQIALTVAEANGCEYCLSAHTAIGKLAGLDEGELISSRRAESADARAEAALKFAQAVVKSKGRVNDDAFKAVRAAGYGDKEIAEIIANVAINIFTNYFNNAIQVEVDFPRAKIGLATS